MKIKEINLSNLKRKGLALIAIPVMLGSLTACHKAENKNTKTEVVSESTETLPVMNSTETTISTTTSTVESTSSTTSKEKTSTTTTTATTTTATEAKEVNYAHELLTDEEYNKILNTKFEKENLSDLFIYIGKNHTPEQAKQICDIIFEKAIAEGRVGPTKTVDVTCSTLSSKCLSPEMVEMVKKALTTFEADKAVNLNDELKEKYIYLYDLYTAYTNAADLKDTYLMIINGAKIYDAMRNMDELLLKNKITDEERLNYYVSYENGELKDSNLFLGDSLLKDYFEQMKYYVTSENYIEYCDWVSTDFIVENSFEMIEEQFAVEKINGKYVALKLDENTLNNNKQKTLN